MNEIFLIAHKVRGNIAFDIAINIGSEEDGDLWLIPTSGHRAYPYWYLSLDHIPIGLPDMPDSLPDHYAINDIISKPKPEPTLEDLL